MKKKINLKKNKKKEKVILTKEVGVYNDFLIIEKETDKKEINIEKKNKSEIKEYQKQKEIQLKDDLNDLSFFKDWIFLENPFKKPEKSRFDDLFKEIKEEEEKSKQKSSENKEEENDNLKKDNSSIISSSINLSSQLTYQSTTSFDTKKNEGISINDSLLDNNNIKIVEDKNIDEPKDLIEELNLNLDINKVISLEDKRATIMIKNIPNKFNKDLLLRIINQNFKGTYDLFILPTDINKYKNFGYSFINFTSSYYIPYFYYMFNGKMWSNTNSKKICELTYSKVQGKTNLLAHYPSKIVYCNEEAFNVTPEQKYVIPNVYKLIFNKFFPKEKIEEYKFYFITKMPTP